MPAESVALPPFWNRLADGIGRFHTEVHDGFRAKFGGILPTRGLRGMASTPDIDFLDEQFRPLPDETRPDLDDLVVVVIHEKSGLALDVGGPDRQAWEVGEFVERCRLDPWSGMDYYVMQALDSDLEYFDRFGYSGTDYR